MTTNPQPPVTNTPTIKTNIPEKPVRVVEYLTRQEAAAFLRISVRLLDQKAAKGEIAYYKLGNGPTSRVLYQFKDLKKYIEKCRVEI